MRAMEERWGSYSICSTMSMEGDALLDVDVPVEAPLPGFPTFLEEP
jgi:hypothetical protein